MTDAQEHKEIVSLIRKVGENKFKFIKQPNEPDVLIFKDRKGNAIEFEKAGKTFKNDLIITKTGHDQTHIINAPSDSSHVQNAFFELKDYLKNMADIVKKDN